MLDRQHKLEQHDYIGTKISEGRATREEYATEIEAADQWSAELNAATAEIARLKALTPDVPSGSAAGNEETAQ